uniref:Homologous recombination OB-fold protein OB-fold domain-containing protein n=1 Tax=Clastoptera arizonana TaxID=38151 RepID=A0A1B6CTF2_9HEMI
MFEDNDNFEVDEDFLDDVLASEHEALENSNVQQDVNPYFKLPSNDINKIAKSHILQQGFNNQNTFFFEENNTVFGQNTNDRNVYVDHCDQSNAHKTNKTPCRNSEFSLRKRQRKFPGPAGLLPERGQNSCFGSPIRDLDLDGSLDTPKEELYSQPGSLFDEETWQCLISDLGSHRDILKILNIGSIKKKAAARCLTKKKVPFLAALLHSIDASAPDPCVILRDSTGEMHGTLHRNVWGEFGAELKTGCVLVLRNVGVLSTGFISRRHYLNITSANLVTLYTTSKGKVQASENTSVPNLNFKKFIEDWRNSVYHAPVLSPGGNALSLFNTVTPQAECSRIPFSVNSPQIKNNNTQNNCKNPNAQNKSSQLTIVPPVRVLNPRTQFIRQPPLVVKQNNSIVNNSLNRFNIQASGNQSFPKTHVNQRKSNHKQSQDMFLSCGSSKNIGQSHLNVEETQGRYSTESDAISCTNNRKNITFKTSESFLKSKNLYQQPTAITGSNSNQNTLLFSQDLPEEERCVVESMFDGIDSEALFDDF